MDLPSATYYLSATDTGADIGLVMSKIGLLVKIIDHGTIR